MGTLPQLGLRNPWLATGKMFYMKLVIPHALPPQSTAHALVEPFASRYPKLTHLLNAKQANAQSWPVSQHGCTPDEGLRLQALGWEAKGSLPIGAALAAVHAGVASGDEPVWVAQLCATIISQERATALPLALIQASTEDIDALEKTASPLFASDGDGIDIEPIGQGLWRVHAALPTSQRTISPLALMGEDLGDWWPTDDAWRAWRKRVNEIQMAWHDHPVNRAREHRGLPAINSVWLYGGANGFEPTQARRQDLEHMWLEQLSDAARRGDWARWLDAWAAVQAALLAAGPDDEIVLTGENRLVRLQNAPKRWWQNLFAQTKQDSWRSWWLNQS